MTTAWNTIPPDTPSPTPSASRPGLRNLTEESSRDYWLPVTQRPRPPSITDGIEDLLDLLEPRRRRGMIAWLSVGYYEGWHPGRQEIADLIGVELGLLTVDDYVHRKHQRRQAGATVTDITTLITERVRRTRR